MKLNVFLPKAVAIRLLIPLTFSILACEGGELVAVSLFCVLPLLIALYLYVVEPIANAILDDKKSYPPVDKSNSVDDHNYEGHGQGYYDNYGK